MAKAPSTSNDFAPSWLNFTDNIYSKPTAAQRNNFSDKSKDLSKRKPTFSSSNNQSRKSSVRDVEFPSLNDKSNAVEQNGSNGSNIPSSPENVWSKPPTLKSVQSNMVPQANIDNKPPSAIYKSLVPKATPCAVKAYKRSLSANSSPSWSPTANKPKDNALHTKAPPVLNNPSVDYRSNVQVLKRTKIRQRKAKTEFLTEIRQDSDDTNNSSEEIIKPPRCTESNMIKIPINHAHFNNVEEDEQHLSSSLEEEHRLLRQMGWSSNDEQPLTEEEIQEYFLKHEVNSNNNTLISQVEKKRNLINAMAEWSCTHSDNKSTSSMGNNPDSNPVDLIYDVGLGKGDTDSDLSSLEDDLM